jgi:hypothetical protein
VSSLRVPLEAMLIAPPRTPLKSTTPRSVRLVGVGPAGAKRVPAPPTVSLGLSRKVGEVVMNAPPAETVIGWLPGVLTRRVPVSAMSETRVPPGMSKRRRLAVAPKTARFAWTVPAPAPKRAMLSAPWGSTETLATT